MSKKTRGPQRPRPKGMRLVAGGADDGSSPPEPAGPKPGSFVRREGVPIELHLRDPIPGPDGKLLTVLVEGQGIDWSLVSMVAPNTPKQGLLVAAYQIQIVDENGEGWLVTVPIQNVIGSRTPVRRVPPKPPEPVP